MAVNDSSSAYPGTKTRLSVVVYVDILGFSQAVADAHLAKTENELLARLDTALGKARTNLAHHPVDSDELRV
jgi:hypothetical protein